MGGTRAGGLVHRGGTVAMGVALESFPSEAEARHVVLRYLRWIVCA